jgi:hypothetical protein
MNIALIGCPIEEQPFGVGEGAARTRYCLSKRTFDSVVNLR